MSKKPFSIGHVAESAIALLQAHPEGLTVTELRKLVVGGPDTQEHFTRRLREIRKVYVLETHRRGPEIVYCLAGLKETPPGDSGQISEKLRAAVLHKAHGKCQMCGRSIAGDGIKLQVDHKLPQNWGGLTVEDNLWAICESCNRGKRDFFSSFNDSDMNEIVNLESVHERIAYLLKRHIGEPVPAYVIEFIANAKEQQLDWRKRLRELRYPVVGLEITVSKKKDSKGVQSYYTLEKWVDLPKDITKLLKDYEKKPEQEH